MILLGFAGQGLLFSGKAKGSPESVRVGQTLLNPAAVAQRFLHTLPLPWQALPTPTSGDISGGCNSSKGTGSLSTQGPCPSPEEGT